MFDDEVKRIMIRKLLILSRSGIIMFNSKNQRKKELILSLIKTIKNIIIRTLEVLLD